MKRVSRTLVNFVFDCLLLTLLLALSWCSVVLQFLFPPGPSAGGWRLWGGNYVVWRNVQFALLCALALAVLVHIMLHWNWICGVISHQLARRRPARVASNDGGQHTLWGVAALIFVVNSLGLAVAIAALTIEQSW